MAQSVVLRNDVLSNNRITAIGNVALIDMADEHPKPNMTVAGRSEESLLRDRERQIANRLKMAFDQHRGGASLLAGTDADAAFHFVFFESSLHEELALFVNAGLTPKEALRAATVNPAQFLKAEDSLGTIEPGKLADLVLLDANPLDDIKNTTRIRAVGVNGR